MTATRVIGGVDLLACQRRDGARYPLLLESVADGNARSRWDLLLATDGTHIRLDRDGVTRDQDGVAIAGDFLSCLDSAWSAARTDAQQGLRGPFQGGWALFLAYELAGQVEPVLALPPAAGSLPMALAVRCPAVLLRDRSDGSCMALVEAGHEALLDTLEGDAAASVAEAPALRAWQPPHCLHEDAAAAFDAGVRRILDYLAAGDVFQANLSRGWVAHFSHAPDPGALYARLREANPAPFSGLFVFDDWAVASASPERLVSVRGTCVETRPIAGTRPRVPGDDDGLRMQELATHPKERAEHVMLVDLERNDLGRVCVAGSVEVDELMRIESYAHVHHIVSNVRGRLLPTATPGAVIRAVFPGGTITGCPKVRCMEVIAELERGGRGAYTGAMGWLGRDGDMDLNILIRSAEIEGREVRFRTGAGIVADSDPARELEETRAKARGMLLALGMVSAAASDPSGGPHGAGRYPEAMHAIDKRDTTGTRN